MAMGPPKAPRNKRRPSLLLANRFEAFARMRLAGENDLIYRSYDLLASKHYQSTDDLLRRAGCYVPHTGPTEVLIRLQRQFQQWGYAPSIDDIITLIRENWAYQQICHGGVTKWTLRSDDEIKRLYAENEAATRQAFQSQT